MQITLILGHMKEIDPMVVIPKKALVNDEMKFPVEQIPGEWIRVFPQNAADVFFIQELRHRVEKFAPATGSGVIIDPRCLSLDL